jgi:hypothetical protein
MATQTEHPRLDIERIRRDVDRAIEEMQRSKKLYDMKIWPIVLASFLGGAGLMVATVALLNYLWPFLQHALR